MTKTKLMALIAVTAVATAAQGFAASYRQVGPIEDDNYAGIQRISARIIVPDGLSREQLKQTLTDAVKAIAAQYDADAAMVFAYRSQDTDVANSAWTAGKAVYAPNGKWEDAAQNAAKEVTIQIGDIYFQERPTDTLGQGSGVTLVSADGTPISISRSRDSWTADQILASIPSGASATVLERYEKALSANYLFVRYRIRATHQGNPLEGWVFEEDIAK